MQQRRPTPFDLIFEAVSHTTFPAIRSALAAAGDDPRDRDAFLMVPAVVMLLRDLRPDGGLGEGIGQLAALVHHGYLFWDAGSVTVDVSLERLAELLGGTPGGGNEPDQPPFYTQLPTHRIWAQVIPGDAHEPLDGY